jgi:hypothetical protein
MTNITKYMREENSLSKHIQMKKRKESDINIRKPTNPKMNNKKENNKEQAK